MLVLKRKQTTMDYTTTLYRYRHQQNKPNNNNTEQIFKAELIVKTVGGRPHWQLVWARYAMQTTHRSTREESTVDFELGNNSYPALLFSRVRSFTAVSDKPLS